MEQNYDVLIEKAGGWFGKDKAMLDIRKRQRAESTQLDAYSAFMIRELLVWLVGVPVPIAMVIGIFVL